MKQFASTMGLLRRGFTVLCIGFAFTGLAIFLRYRVIKKPFGLSAPCFTFYKKLTSFGWDTKKNLYYDGYLRDLVAVYKSSYFVEEEKFTDALKAVHEDNQKVVLERFDHDLKKVVGSVLYHLGSVQAGSDQTYIITVQNLQAHLQTRYSGNQEKAQHMYAVLDYLMGTEKEQLLKTGFDIKDIIVTRDIGTRALAEQKTDTFERDRMMLMGIILDTVIKKELTPRFYDYDYLDEIEIITESVYTLYQEAGSPRGQRFLQALALLTQVTQVTQETPDKNNSQNNNQKLSQRIKSFLGQQHPYIPKRASSDPLLKKANPAVHDALAGIKAEDNMQGFLDANTKYSGEQLQKQGKTDSRQLSLLRGYEKNHHVMLRTIIGLIRDGKLTKNDEVLIIGPRYVDEIIFFRKYLGLPKTIGLDLCANDHVVVGDMHKMPFENGRFKLIYVCNTLCYSYHARKAVDEIARVLQRPGYACIIDHGTYKEGASLIGRSDVMNADALVGMFYKNRYNVLAKDHGTPLVRYASLNQASCALELY